MLDEESESHGEKQSRAERERERAISEGGDHKHPIARLAFNRERRSCDVAGEGAATHEAGKRGGHENQAER